MKQPKGTLKSSLRMKWREKNKVKEINKRETKNDSIQENEAQGSSIPQVEEQSNLESSEDRLDRLKPILVNRNSNGSDQVVQVKKNRQLSQQTVDIKAFRERIQDVSNLNLF